MINPKELRIGNYVYNDENVVQKIALVQTKYYALHKGQYDCSTAITEDATDYYETIINPIYLNEKWLLDFGFEKREAGEDEDYVVYFEKSKLTICNFGDGFVLSNAFSPGLRVQLKYVHQLQNLFYFIINLDLELDP